MPGQRPAFRQWRTRVWSLTSCTCAGGRPDDVALLLLSDDQIFDLGVGCGRDNLLVEEFVLPFVRPVLDDLGGVCRADAGQSGQLVGSCGIDIEETGGG